MYNRIILSLHLFLLLMWVEVSHRRKKKTVIKRGRSVLNNCKQQDRSGTWRDKDDVTSFYFSRFPDGLNEKDL